MLSQSVILPLSPLLSSPLPPKKKKKKDLLLNVFMKTMRALKQAGFSVYASYKYQSEFISQN